MLDAIKALGDTPIPTILVVAGIFFLLLSVAHKVSGYLEVPPDRRLHSQILGVGLLAIGIVLNIQPKPETRLNSQPAQDSEHTSPQENEPVALNADPRAPEPFESEWETLGQYTITWNTQKDRGYFPVQTEGRDADGVSMYRSKYIPRPAKVSSWYSYMELDPEEFAQKDKKLKADGYQRVWLQSFIDGAGVERYQAIWTKSR